MFNLPTLTSEQFEQFEDVIERRLGFRMNKPQADIMRMVAGLIETDKTNLMIQASPGAGKTTLIVILSQLIEFMVANGYLNKYPKILALAHMRQNRAMLENYLPQSWCKVSTVHALGHRLISSRYKLSKWKIPNITQAVLKKHYPMGVPLIDEDNQIRRKSIRDIYWSLAQFISVLQIALIEPSNIQGIEWLYLQYTPRIAGITDEFRNAIIYDIAPDCLQGIISNREDGGYISFDEQITLPITEYLINPEYDIVIADEAQDLSPSQQIILERSAKFAFVVGDRNQAIMKFAGADVQSWNRLAYILDAHVMTMPISQRCPVEVIRYLQGIFKEVTPRENAPSGKVLSLDKDKFSEYADSPDTGVICRTHADVGEAYITLMESDVKTPIVVLGSDVFGVIQTMIRQMSKLDYPLPFNRSNFNRYVMEWVKQELRKVDKIELPAERDIAMEEIKGNASLCRNLWTFFNPSSPDEFVNLVGVRFGTSPDDIAKKQKLFRKSIVVGTTHAWKGLEINRVIVYNTENFLKFEDETQNQEREVFFVAMSRSQNELAFLPKPITQPVKQVDYDVQYVAYQNKRLPYPNFNTEYFSRNIEFEAHDGLSTKWNKAIED